MSVRPLSRPSSLIILDNLIEDRRLAEIIVAFTYPDERLTEYPDDPDHAEWLTCELLPQLEKRYPLRATPAGRCLMGTSFGAVAALSTAVRFPQTYGSLLLQSGSFPYSNPAVTHGEGSDFDPVVRFIDHYRAHPYARQIERSSPAVRTKIWSMPIGACCRSSAAAA